MKNRYKLMLLSALSLFTMHSNAQQVSIEDAQAKAINFLNQPAQVKARKVQASPNSLKLAYKSESGNKSLFYVFNSTSSVGGFVIVGGDEAAQDILGYSERGSFDYVNMPENLKWWLSQYNIQIEEAIKDVQSGNASIVKESSRKLSRRKAKSNISYFLTTEWDQVAPYNSQIPLYAQGFTGNNALATGCVATAGAQIMKYYNWPTSGIGSATASKTINGISFSADFANTTYDWANMQDTYSYDKYTGSAADKAVGTLMYHIGVAVDMNYGQLRSGGSSASTMNLAIRLADTFKYDKGIMYLDRSSYTDQDWEDLIYSELNERRPVLYSGTSDAPDGGGHAFVCDGYQDGRYHINWGWSGSYNGYFLLTSTSTEKALAPNGTGSGGSASNSSYVKNQSIGINIKPDYTGTSKPVRNITAGEYTLPETVVSKGGWTHILGLMWNKGLFADTFEFAVKLVNTSDPTDTHIVEADDVMSIDPNHGKGYIYYQIPNEVRYGAYYYIYPMFKNDNNEWQLATLPLGFNVPYLQIETPTGLNFEEFAISNNGYVSEGNFNISLEIKNWGNFATSIPINLWVFPRGGGSGVDYINLGTVHLNSKESKNFNLQFNDFIYKNQFELGKDYYIKAYNPNSGQYISSNIYFTFCENINIDYAISPVEWGTICLPFEAAIPEGCKAYTVTSTDDNELMKSEVAKLEMNKPYLINGPKDTYQFSGPATPEGKDYKNGILYGMTAPSTDVSPLYAPQDSYVLQNGSEGLGFYHVSQANKQKVRQYSAYLKLDTNSAKTIFRFTEDATSIETANSSVTVSPSYRLNGVMTNRNAKGLVITNGKLMFNK